MARKRIISPKSSTVKHNKNFKHLPEARVIFAKRHGFPQYSWNELARQFQTSPTRVARWYQTIERYIEAGIEPQPEPINKEVLS